MRTEGRSIGGARGAPGLQAISALLATGLLAAVGAACGSDECHSNTECGTGRICRLGLCALDPGIDTGTSDGDASTLEVELSCGPATAADLVVNEVLADPPAGADVDGNGEADTTKDEFVEVVNVGNEPVALTAVALDVNGKQVSLGALCLNPNQARVLFGATGLPSVKNDGGTIKLIVSGVTTQTVTYGSDASHDASLTLATQLDPTSAWVRHDTAFGSPYSPSKCANGNDFPDCAGTTTPPDTVDGDTVQSEVVPTCSDLPAIGDLVINELLADPGTGAKPNDANKDGLIDGDDDEFVEVVNVSAKTLLVDGVKVRDASGKTTTVAGGKCLPPNGALLFLGKLPDGADFGDVIAIGATAGLSLNNDGDSVTLLDGADTVLQSVTYGSDANADQSITRQTDLDPNAPFVKHTLAPNGGGTSMSPGRCQGGQAFSDCGAPPTEMDPDAADVSETSPSEVIDETTVSETSVGGDETTEVTPTCGSVASAADLIINEVMLAPPAAFDSNGDGTYSSTDDEYVEIINAGGVAVTFDGLQLWVQGEKRYAFPSGICLRPHEAVVVFGKTASTYTEAGVTALATHSAIALANGGTVLAVTDSLGATLLSETIGGLTNESWTRAPDATTSAFVKHKTATGSPGTAGSPGKCTNGAVLPGCLIP